MKKTGRLLILVCLLVPVAAKAASGPAQPTINCKSAKSSSGVAWKTYVQYCAGESAAERARAAPMSVEAAPGASIGENLKTPNALAALGFPGVPTWTDAEIMAQFAATRDTRYMTTPHDGEPPPGFLRRISWMFPDDGCYARAEEVHTRVNQAGFQARSPYKLFAVSYPLRLRAYTDNAVSGVVNWDFHVVPVVKNTAGQVIVFDAALSPCRPLPWKDWLALLADDPSTEFSDPANGHGVAVGDPNAYLVGSAVSGEPSHANEARIAETENFLREEWNRQQVELQRSAVTVLGPTPPWSGYACVNPVQIIAQATLAANTAGSVTATCPIGTLAVGGGQGLGDPLKFTVSKNAKSSGNGWQITAKNTGTSSGVLTARAECLVGAPSTTTVSSIQGNVVSVNPGSFGVSNAACPAGTLVGGGYTTTQGTTSVMRVYTNRRTSSTSSTWQAAAQNTTTSAKSITAFAYCLPSTNFTFSQNEVAMDGSGVGFVMCSPKNEVGGGFSFPRTSAYQVGEMYGFGSMIYIVNMTSIPSAGDPNAKAYAECLVHP